MEDMWGDHRVLLCFTLSQSLASCNLFFLHMSCLLWGPFSSFLVAQMVNNLPAIQETWVQSLGGEDPLEEGMATHSAILTWRIPHGQRSLVGYSLWGCKESDTTE